jgi:hypothetical protein
MSVAVPIESFGFAVSKSISDALVQRISQLMVELIQLMRQAYEAKFKVSNAGGASSSLTFDVERTGNLITALIGAAKPNMYLQYLEYGVKGTVSTPPGGAFYARTKAPPFKNIYDWVRAAAIPIPKWMVDRASANTLKQSKGEKLDPSKPWYTETDPLRMLAYYTMISIKQKGTPALHIIEKVLTQQQARIEQALASI